MFSLAALIELAANDEPLAVTLSPLVVHLILAALSYAEDETNWIGAGYELTPEEVDTIRALVAEASDKLTGGD